MQDFGYSCKAVIKIISVLDFNNIVQYGKMCFYFFLFGIFLIYKELIVIKIFLQIFNLNNPCIFYNLFIYIIYLFVYLFVFLTRIITFGDFFPLTTNQCYHCNTVFVTWAFKQKKVAVNHHALTVKIIWVDPCILTLHSVLVLKKSYYFNSVSILKNNSLLLRFKFMESL